MPMHMSVLEEIERGLRKTPADVLMEIPPGVPEEIVEAIATCGWQKLQGDWALLRIDEIKGSDNAP
jgi:hypothetical protein